MFIQRLSFGDVPAAQAVVNRMRYLSEGHRVLTELRRDVFYGGTVWVAWQDHEGGPVPVSIHCTKLGKRKKNIWEPYANWYSAFTLPQYRRQGHATTLYRQMEQEALAAGCRRVKSLAGSSAGLALHLSLGHQCWGQTDNNEVWVDSPLPGCSGPYQGLAPPQAPAQRPSPKWELAQIIKQGLRYDTQA